MNRPSLRSGRGAAESRSPSRGKMTITLTSAQGASDETAKVRIDVDNPELVAERVVSQLARNFPPESVMTIAASTRTGSVDETSESSSSLQVSAASSQRRHKLMREEIMSDCASADLGPLGRFATNQAYLVSKELDMAVPVTAGQREIRLMDNSCVSVSDSEVCTVFYDETGHACGSSRGFNAESCDTHECPDKKGIATFVQDFALSDSLELAVPTCPSQTCIHLVDGDVHEIDPSELHTLFYGEKGLALFTRASDGSVGPGVPSKPGVALAAVPHRVLSDQASVMASSTAAKAVTARDKHVNTVLFDSLGQPICVRKPSGGLVPGGLPQKDAAAKAEYFFTPSGEEKDRPVQIVELKDGPVTLANGKVVTAFPDDISYTLLNEAGEELGAFVNNRRPSYVAGPSKTLLPAALRCEPRAFPAPRRSAQWNSCDTTPDQPVCARERQPRYQGPGGGGGGQQQHNNNNNNNNYDRQLSTLSSRHERTRPHPTSSNLRMAEATIFSRSQHYFTPRGLDYAIPVLANQLQVKLTTGEKVKVDKSKVFWVEHDRRGLPLRTIMPDGRTREWAINKPGVALKYQDFFLHDELVFAVPIVPGQMDVVVSDGSSLEVLPENIVSVYYDANGRASFSFVGKRRRIRPGLHEHAGVAASLQYYMLLDCHDGSGEQFVMPFKGHQTSVDDPYHLGRKMPVDRGNVTIVFYDERRQPLYTQLADGSLVAGGLLGPRAPTSATEDGDEYTSQLTGMSDFDTSSIGRSTRNNTFEYQTSNFLSSTTSGNKQTPTTKPSRNAKQSKTRQPETSSTPFSSSSPSTRPKRQEIIERRVPVQQIEFVEKIVEVPEVHFVEKHVEVEQIEYETRIVKKKQVIERPVEHVKYVPKIETRIVERIIEVPQIIEVPRAEIIEQKVSVDRFIDTKKEVVVSQQFTPVIRDSADIVENVECLRLEPELIPVDVFVPKLVKNRLLAAGKSNEKRKEVDLSLGHYNSLVLKMNPTFANNYERLPMIKTSKGSFPLLPKDARITVTPPTGAEIASLLEQTGLIARSLTDRERAKLEETSVTSYSGRLEAAATDALMSDFAPRTSALPNYRSGVAF